MLGVLWSVAIEEQFYFIWPIILFICPLKKLWIPFVIIIVGSFFFRAYNDSVLLTECHTLSCIGDMTIGAVGAWLIAISDGFKRTIEKFTKIQIGTIYIVFTFIYFFRSQLLFANYGIRIFERIFIATVIILIILEQTFSKKSLFKISDFKRISELGKITYGLYCLHFIGILIAISITKKLSINTHLWEVLFIETPLALTFSLLVSKISFKFYETPFLKLKERYS